MIHVSAVYPRKEGARFDWAYYLGHHVPLVRQRLGAALQGVAVEQGTAGIVPGSPPDFVAIAHLRFESAAAFYAAFGPHAAEIMADVAKFTSIEPMLQVSDVKE